MYNLVGKKGWWQGDYVLKIKIGDICMYHNRLIKFIKVARKGFNFLDLSTNICLFNRNFYDTRFSNKYIPNKVKEFHIKVPVQFKIVKILGGQVLTK